MYNATGRGTVPISRLNAQLCHVVFQAHANEPSSLFTNWPSKRNVADYDPDASGPGVVKASRVTEELYNAIVKNDVAAVYAKIDEGADVNFVFGAAYSCPEGYNPLMVACHRGEFAAFLCFG